MARTQTMTTAPWESAQPFLEGALSKMDKLYNAGAFRTPGFSPMTKNSFNMIFDQAGKGITPNAGSFLTRMMGGSQAPSVMPAINGMNAGAPNYSDMISGMETTGLDAARNRAISSAVPAAAAMFAGSGMADSSPAMREITTAAVDAAAPYDYNAHQAGMSRAIQGMGMDFSAREAGLARMMQGLGMDQNAYETSMGRGMTAAGLAPGIDAAGFLPAQMVGQVGAKQDAYNRENSPAQQFRSYLSNLLPIAGMGSTTTQPGQSGLSSILGGVSGGLGTYGALMANPVTAPFAAIGGLASGLAGIL